MNIKKSVKPAKNSERDQKVQKAKAELSWLGLGATIVTGFAIWSFVGPLNIPLKLKLVLVVFPCVFVCGSLNTIKRYGKREVAEGMSTSEAIGILGEPHRKTTLGEVLKDYDFVGGSLSADSPRSQKEFWLYQFDKFEYEITIQDGKVSKVKKIEKK